MQCIETQPGYERAASLCGAPERQTYRYEVSADTFDYWGRVTRRRQAEVVLLVSLAEGRYLVHTKAFYPAGVYRLLSGGLRPGEDLLAGLRRELYEETGLEGRVRAFVAAEEHRFERNGAGLDFCSFLFAVDARGGQPVVQHQGEQISAFRQVDRDGLLDVAERLERLEPAWEEWGRYRATAHRAAWAWLGREPERHA